MTIDATIHKLLDADLRRHIENIPHMINGIFPQIKRVWKFDNDFNFMYGWYVGRLENNLYHVFVHALKRMPDDEAMEIKEMIEVHGKEIRKLISNSLD